MVCICSLRETSRCVPSICFLTRPRIFFSISRISISPSRRANSFSSWSLAVGSSRTACLSNSLMGRWAATVSASFDGSSRELSCISTSEGIFLLSFAKFSKEETTLRTSAWVRGPPNRSIGCSSTLTWKYRSFGRYWRSFARNRPSTSTLTVPSGSFRIWTMWATVPMGKISPSPGSFVAASFWAARKMSRSCASEASRAAIDLSLPMKRGTTMCGNTTMSRNGSSGRILFLSSMRPPLRTAVPPTGGESGRVGLRQFGLLPLHDFGRHLAGDHVFGDDALLDVALGRDLVHDVQHDVLEYGTKPPRPRLAHDGLPGDALQGVFAELELHVLELEQPLVLPHECVLRLREDLDQRSLVELVQRCDHREATHELGDEPEPDQVLRLRRLEELADVLIRAGDDVGREPHHLLRGPPFHDTVEPDERPPAEEEDIARVDLDEVLLRVLAAALRGDVRDRPLQDLEQRLLDSFAGDVPRDRRVLRLARDLVDLVDVDDPLLGLLHIVVGRLEKAQDDVLDVLPDVPGLGERGRVRDRERDVQDAGQGLGQKGLPAPRGTQQEDVRLLELDPVDGAGLDPLVVVVHRDGQDLLGPLLADHVFVEDLLDFRGLREPAALLL